MVLQEQITESIQLPRSLFIISIKKNIAVNEPVLTLSFQKWIRRHGENNWGTRGTVIEKRAMEWGVPQQRLTSFDGKSRFHWFSNHSWSFKPKQCYELGRLDNPQAQMYCYVSWVLSYKAHYATETKRRNTPRTETLVCTQNTHTGCHMHA